MAKKPWREIQFTDDSGRFTRQQIEDAMRKVMDRREAKAHKPKADRRARAGGVASRLTSTD